MVGVNSDESVLQASLVGLLVRGDRTVCDMFGRIPKQNQQLRPLLGKELTVSPGATGFYFTTSQVRMPDSQ